MEANRSREDLVDILDRNIAWIGNCDSKASIVVGGIGVLLGILLTTDYVTKLLQIYQYMGSHVSFWSATCLVISALSFVGFITGCFLLIGVLIARVDPEEFKNKNISTNSLIFFSSISKRKSLDIYRKELVSQDNSEIINDYISQIYICSLICDKKFKLYKLGLLFSVLGFFIFIVTASTGYITIKLL